MGGGSWTSDSFVIYSCTRGMTTAADGSLDIKHLSATQVYKQNGLNPILDPKNVIRECCDSDEHPNTVPVILALDVTGSMGQAAVEVAAELNKIMTEIYKSVKDVEFMIMGIGDFDYDDSPLQVSQFESDIRIAEQLDKLYFEFGGGPNPFESYTAAWMFALNNTRLDCWKRGKKGIIITMGDEILNPYIKGRYYREHVGGQDGTDIETSELYPKVKEKFDIYHIHVNHKSYDAFNDLVESWVSVIGKDNFIQTDSE